MFHTKENFEAALAEQFGTSISWRKANCRRFKDDRNLDAANRLLKLQSEINIPDDVWEFIKRVVTRPTA